MVQAQNPFEAHQSQNQQSLAASHIDEPMSENCGKARKWLAENFSPFICVFSSKNTQRRMLETNGLTPAEFLRPFGEVGNLGNYLVRTSEKNLPYKLNRFRVNFVDSHLMSDHPKPSDRIPEKIINENKPKVRSDMANMANIHSKNSKQAINANLQDLIGPTRLATERSQTPWFTQMKQHLYQTNRFAQHELTQQPIAFIYFLSVEDKDPLTTIDRLRTTETLPKQYRTGIYDNSKQIMKQFVLILNDYPGESRFQPVMTACAKQFSESIIHEIKMSAGPTSPPPPGHKYWDSYLDLDLRAFDKSPNRETILGKMFTTNDRTQAQQIIRKVIEKTLIPFSVQRISAIEANIAKTRKGISKFFRVFKSSERGENDGMASNFRMNRSELELRTLIDLSFVIQDYETTYTNAEYPSSDFKRIKAHLHAAHCDEIKLYARMAHEKYYAQNDMKSIVSTANGIYEMYAKGQSAQSNSSQSLIRFSLMMAELFQVFGEHEHAADFFVRLANKLADKAILKAMCFEQAGYEYLMLSKFRKFSYYMTLAGQSYERMGQRDLKYYSFNCFTIVHPFYQARKGWNTIQYQLYSLLGANSEIADGNSQLAVQFFRNLLLLTHQFNDVNQQRQCLTASLQAFRKFQQDSDDQSNGSNIGYLELPQILPHTIEVFIDHEKVLTNLKEPKIPIVPGGSYCANQGECNLIEQKFINFNGFYRDESAVEQAQKQASKNANSIVNDDINQSNIPWRILQKQITEFMRKSHGPELTSVGSEGEYNINGDEMTECAVHDATCLKERCDTTHKKQRKVFKDTAIRVRFMLRNPLLTDISISNLRLCCRYAEEEKKEEDGVMKSAPTSDGEEVEFLAEQKEMQLPSQEQIEVILKVVPQKSGQLIIEQIRWELYDIFKCEYDLIKSESTQSEVRPEFRSILPRQLIEKEKSFSYQVLNSSAEISAKIELKNNANLPRLGQQSRLVFSETDSGQLFLKNLSPTHTIRNIFLLCSHPIIFDLYIKKLMVDNDSGSHALELKPNEEVQIPINFRATLKGDFSVRFLFRYEVVANGSEVLPATCRFRFQRLIMFINSQCLFTMNPVVHMSFSEPDQYIVNLMTSQKLSTTWYERPQVSTIEAIRGANKWCLNKKDSFGNFFTVKPRENSKNEFNDELPGAQLAYLRQSQFVDDVLEGLDGEQTFDLDSLTKDKVAYTFMQRETDHMENTVGKKWRKTEDEAENEQIDLVVRWQMKDKGKAGFITLFGVQLLREKKALTNFAGKILEAQQVLQQRAIRQRSGKTSSRSQSISKRETLSNQKLSPIRVTFDFPPTIMHHFSEDTPCKQIKIVLKIQNLLQNDKICQYSVEIVANQSWKKGKGRYSVVDVSEGESFLWAGKTTHKLQNFKLNETKQVVLKANLPHQGLFNLNRFNILIKQLDCSTKQQEMLVSEYRVRDALMVHVKDPITREREDTEQLLMQLTDNAPYDFSK